MSNRTVIGILVIAAALLGFIFFFERDTMTTSELAERRDRAFPQFIRDRVTELEIRGMTGEKVVLKRDPVAEETGQEQWRITEPRPLGADDTAVRSLLSALDYLIVNRTVQGKAARDETRFGLKEPRIAGAYTIRGTKTTFAIGGDAQGDKVYLGTSAASDVVYAVDRSFLESTDKGLSDLRSKKIISLELDEAIGLDLNRPSGPVRLKREAQKSWHIDRDGAWILAAVDQIDALLVAVEDLAADEFVADDVNAESLGDYGLKDPAISIGVTLPGEGAISLLVGQSCRGKQHRRYVTASGTGTVACIKDDILPLLERPADRFEERRPLVFEDSEVTEIQLSGTDKSLVFVRDDAVWKLKEDEKYELEQSAIKDLLGALRDTRATGLNVGATAVAGLGSPTGKVSLTIDSDTVHTLALYGGAAAETARLRRADEQAVLTVPRALVETLVPEQLAYRKRSIENGKAFDIEALRIQGNVSQELEKKDGTWQVVAPISVSADSGAVRTLTDLMAEIKARRFVARTAAKEHGFNKPFSRVTARFAEEKQGDGGVDRTGSREVQLEVGAVAGDGERFARILGDDPVVFVVDASYEEAVAAPMVARDLLQLDDTAITQLSLEGEEATLVLVKRADKWEAENDVPFDREALPRLIADLGGIKTVRAVSFGKAGSAFDTPVLVVKAWTEEQLESNTPQVITVGLHSDDAAERGTLARVGDLDVTFVIPSRIVDELVAFLSPKPTTD